MRTSQRVSRQLMNARSTRSTRSARAGSQKAKSVITPTITLTITPTTASIKRRYSNQNKLLAALTGLGVGLGVGFCSGLLVMKIHTDARYVRATRAMCDYLGYDPDDIQINFDT